MAIEDIDMFIVVEISFCLSQAKTKNNLTLS